MRHHILLEPTLNWYVSNRSFSNFSWNINCLKFLSWFYTVSKEIPGWYGLPSNKQRAPDSKFLSAHSSLSLYLVIRRCVTSDVETHSLGNLRIITCKYIKMTVAHTINLPLSRTSYNECPHKYSMSHKRSKICMPKD